jgi:tetratricopeptide (TPR) repeat protein
MWLGLLACSSPGERGDKAWAEQDPEGAVLAYGQGQDLSDAQRQRYARALMQVGDTDAAQAAMSMVAVLSGDGWVVQVLGEPDPVLALSVAEEGLEDFAEPALFLKACTLALQTGHASAMGHCTQASLVLPQDPLPRLAMAELSLQQGLLPSARELLESASRLEMDRDERLWLTSLWEGAGDPEQACSAGLVLAEDLYSVAAVCISAQRPAGEAMLGRLESPEAAALRLRLAVGRAEVARPGPAQVKQVAIAHAALRQCGELQGTPAVLTDTARLALVEADPAKAEALLLQATQIRPAELAPWLNLARLMARDGRGESALELLESAPSFGPTEDLALHLERHQLSQSLGSLDSLALQELLDGCARQGHARCLAESSYLMALHLADDPHQAAPLLDQAVLYGGASLGFRALSEPALLKVLRSSELSAWDQDPRFADIRVQAQKMPTR